jgi:hypothetical protein
MNNDLETALDMCIEAKVMIAGMEQKREGRGGPWKHWLTFTEIKLVNLCFLFDVKCYEGVTLGGSEKFCYLLGAYSICVPTFLWVLLIHF